MLLPNPVHHHTSGERVLRAGDPIGENAAASGGLRFGSTFGKFRCGQAKDGRKGGLHLTLRRERIAPGENVRRFRLRAILRDGQRVVERRTGFACLLQFAFESLLRLGIRRLSELVLGVLHSRKFVRIPLRKFCGRREQTLNLAGAASAATGVVLAVAVHAADEAEHRVIVRRADGIVFVVVTARAADGQAEKRSAGRDHDVVEIIELRLHGAVRFVVPHVQAIEARRDDGVAPFLTAGYFGELFIRNLVASQLLANEPIVGLVRVEGFDDVVAIAPGVRFCAVTFVAVALGVTHKVKPVASPTFTVVRRGEQAVDEFGPSFVGRVLFKGLDFLRRRRQTDQIKIRAAHQLS